MRSAYVRIGKSYLNPFLSRRIVSAEKARPGGGEEIPLKNPHRLNQRNIGYHGCNLPYVLSWEI